MNAKASKVHSNLASEFFEMRLPRNGSLYLMDIQFKLLSYYFCE